jgi:ribosomal protein S1
MPDAETTRTSLKSGESVLVQVLRVDDRRRRISLSMRVAPWPEISSTGQEVAIETQESQHNETAEHSKRTEGSTK